MCETKEDCGLPSHSKRMVVAIRRLPLKLKSGYCDPFEDCDDHVRLAFVIVQPLTTALLQVGAPRRGSWES